MRDAISRAVTGDRPADALSRAWSSNAGERPAPASFIARFVAEVKRRYAERRDRRQLHGDTLLDSIRSLTQPRSDA
jgi:hypothetical protein